HAVAVRPDRRAHRPGPARVDAPAQPGHRGDVPGGGDARAARALLPRQPAPAPRPLRPAPADHRRGAAGQRRLHGPAGTGLRGVLRRPQPGRVLPRRGRGPGAHLRARAGGGGEQRQRRPGADRADAALRLPAGLARPRLRQAAPEHLPRRLPAAGLRPRRGAARGRPRGDGRGRRRARRPAHLLDQPHRRGLVAPGAGAGPGVRHPDRAGRLAGRPPGRRLPADFRNLRMNPAYATPGTPALPLYLLDRAGFAAWRDAQPAAVAAWLKAQAFDAAPGSAVLLPGSDGIAGAVLGVGDRLDPYAYAHGPQALPEGAWAPQGELPADQLAALQLGWGLGSYRFERYKRGGRAPAQLLLENTDAEALDVLAACARVRDWVNTPTEDMGPGQLEAIARELAQAHGAEVEVVAGDELLAKNFPAIHAVGRASHRAPRLIALRWGDASHPHVAVVGKGVCFDTGGLDIKPADGMRNMKKDMGGAAHALALAGLVMARRLPLRLTLLVPAVENAIGPNALRPGEVIATRKGLSVEVDNTDAEGRLVLCDALAYAAEQKPALMLDFATLTGAARIALGPDLPALFANDDALAE